MANICSNYLKLSGQRETALALLNQLKDGGFNAFIPEPYDADNHWRITMWGDKWDIDPEQSDFDLENLRAQFATAWNPPTGWFHHVAEAFPTVTIELRYEESGNLLWGWMKSDAGILTVATEQPLYDMDADPEHEWMFRASNWYHADRNNGGMNQNNFVQQGAYNGNTSDTHSGTTANENCK
jgi:hypothetical protein